MIVSQQKKRERVDHPPVTGAITGLAGPNAGLVAKLGLSIAGSVIGGATERKLNGQKALDAKEVGKDALFGAGGGVVDGQAERSIASTVIRKVTATGIEALGDLGRRSSETELGSQSNQEQGRQQPVDRPIPPVREPEPSRRAQGES